MDQVGAQKLTIFPTSLIDLYPQLLLMLNYKGNIEFNKAIAIDTDRKVVIMAINKLFSPTGGR